jgi:hypothetical protein
MFKKYFNTKILQTEKYTVGYIISATTPIMYLQCLTPSLYQLIKVARMDPYGSFSFDEY